MQNFSQLALQEEEWVRREAVKCAAHSSYFSVNCRCGGLFLEE